MAANLRRTWHSPKSTAHFVGKNFWKPLIFWAVFFFLVWFRIFLSGLGLDPSRAGSILWGMDYPFKRRMAGEDMPNGVARFGALIGHRPQLVGRPLR